MATQDVAKALFKTLMSVNETDSNLEPANVVDALCNIARSIHHLANAVEEVEGDLHLLAENMQALGQIADAIEKKEDVE